MKLWKLEMFYIGHGCYTGANRAHAPIRNIHHAVMVLIDRNVAPAIARKKVQEAATYPYPHITMTTKDNKAVIELVYKAR